MQNRTLRFLIFSCLIFLGIQACSFPGVYKINVQQGNIITQEMLDQLETGMTKRQVHFVLGTPTLDNVFNENIENYIYTYQKAGGKTENQIVKIYYENDVFKSYEASELLEEHPAY